MWVDGEVLGVGVGKGSSRLGEVRMLCFPIWEGVCGTLSAMRLGTSGQTTIGWSMVFFCFVNGRRATRGQKKPRAAWLPIEEYRRAV